MQYPKTICAAITLSSALFMLSNSVYAANNATPNICDAAHLHTSVSVPGTVKVAVGSNPGSLKQCNANGNCSVGINAICDRDTDPRISGNYYNYRDVILYASDSTNDPSTKIDLAKEISEHQGLQGWPRFSSLNPYYQLNDYDVTFVSKVNGTCPVVNLAKGSGTSDNVQSIPVSHYNLCMAPSVAK